jgi:AraC-like DNA-binding protein
MQMIVLRAVKGARMQYIIAIGIFQALVAVGLLWKNKLRSSADDLLILLVACIATHLAIKFVIYNFIHDVHVRYQMNTFIGFCYGPLLYLYALKIKNPALIPASRWYVFLPFIIGAIAYFTVAGVLFFSGLSGYRLLEWYNQASFWTLLPADLLFVFLALRIARQCPPALHKEQKIIERIANCFLCISVLSLGFYVAAQVVGKDYSIYFRSVIYAILSCMSVMIIRYKYVAISTAAHNDTVYAEAPEITEIQPPATHAVAAEHNPMVTEPLYAVVPEIAGPVVRKSVLSVEEQREVWLALEKRLKGEKLFADSELNLDKLAQVTGISKYHISETLNSYAHKSFYQYINEYRIDFALGQMRQFQEKAIPVNVLSLAYDAGFKAKSSFNRYFKEITGVTPTEYLKSLQQLNLMVGKSMG